VAATNGMARSGRLLEFPPDWLDFTFLKRQKPDFVNA
jgi:hypothetical protein